MEKKQLMWVPIRNNMILEAEDFFISYNPNTGEDHLGGMLTDLANLLGGNLKDGEETALVIKHQDGKRDFFILEGDFRKNYERAILKGKEACMRVYRRNKKAHNSNWSTS